jgi:asparagine synthase (glutamine-hydrolysing)
MPFEPVRSVGAPAGFLDGKAPVTTPQPISRPALQDGKSGWGGATCMLKQSLDAWFWWQVDRRALRPGELSGQRAAGGRYALSGPGWQLHGQHVDEMPVVTDRVVLAFVGRVDNRDEVARALGRPELADAPDGRVLAAAWERWGPTLARSVLGAFCWVAYDRRTGELSGSEDSLGEQALLVREEGDRLQLGSELDVMLSAPVELDPECLAEYLATGGGLATERTLYRGVRRLPPSQALLCGPDGTRLVQSWVPELARELRLADPREYAEAVRDTLQQGVSACLRAHGPVAVDLSGGLDSSSLACVAARLGHADGLYAFRIVHSRSPESDESTFQQAVLDRYPLPEIVIDGDACTALGELPLSPEPPWELLQAGRRRAMLAALAAAGVHTRLVGAGGDELFCSPGSPPLYLAEWLRAGRLLDWARHVRDWSTRRYSLWDLVLSCSFGRSPRDRLLPGEATLPVWLRGEAVAVARHTLERMDKVSAPLGVCARASQLEAIYANARVLRYVRSPGLDLRCPLLYRPLVELVLAMPWEQKLSAASERIVLRSAMEGWLPDKVRLRRDKGDFTPIVLKTVRDNAPRLLELCRGEQLAQLGLVDARSFQAAAERMVLGGVVGADLRLLYGALTLEAWLQARTRSPAVHRLLSAS